MKGMRLNRKQKEDLDSMTQSEGWRIVKNSVEVQIEIANAQLINWSFPFDDEGEPIKKKIMEYKEKQARVGLLKEFLQFVKEPTMIPLDKDTSAPNDAL